MTIQLNRRLFLFGSAAAVAAAAISAPVVALAPPSRVFRAPALKPFARRMIHNLEATAPSQMGGWFRLIVRDEAVLSSGVGAGGSLWWYAPPRFAIAQLPDDVMRLEFDPIPMAAGPTKEPFRIDLWVDDDDDRGRIRGFIEQHQFPSNGRRPLLVPLDD